MQIKKWMFLAILVAAAMLPAAAHADPVVFNLNNPIQNIAIGTTSVTFQGIITNAGPPTVFLNGTSFTISSGATLDDTPFFSLPPSLAPGATTGIQNLFVVNFAATFNGIISGSFTILGGPNASALNDLGTRDFRLVVGQTVEPIPEPATLLLLGTGIAGLGAWRRKRAQS